MFVLKKKFVHSKKGKTEKIFLKENLETFKMNEVKNFFYTIKKMLQKSEKDKLYELEGNLCFNQRSKEKNPKFIETVLSKLVYKETY